MIAATLFGALAERVFCGCIRRRQPAPPRWTLLPSVARVHIDVMPVAPRHHARRDACRAGITPNGDLVMHVAFGATVPFAMDARAFAVPGRRACRADLGFAGEVARDSIERIAAALSLLGPRRYGGRVRSSLPQAAFLRLLAPGNMALLRVRALSALAARGRRRVIARCSFVSEAANGNPLALLRVEVKRGEGASARERT